MTGENATAATLPARDERRLTWAAFALVLVMAVLVSPWTSYFLGNALYYAVPSLVIVALARALSRSGAFALGCELVLSLFLALYKAWVLSQPLDGLVWLGYFFSLPGATLGALVAAWPARVTPGRRAKMFAFGAGATALGTAINLAGLCNSVMYCTL